MELNPTKKTGNEEIDHWIFLEEIEAPMWVDLIEEEKLLRENKQFGGDEEWFNTSHLFHQFSARELRSAFSHHVERNDKFNFNLLGIFSPKLPPSVSKSRGKDYKISNNTMDVSHPISHLDSRSSDLDAGPSPNKKCIAKSKSTDKTYSASSKSIETSDHSFNGTASGSSNVSMSHGDTNDRSTMTANGGSLKNVDSTLSEEHVTSNVSEPSKPAFGNPSELVLNLRIKLRKSCITRQALRVEIVDGGGSKGRKYSTSRSSVVRSSNSGDGAKNMVPEGIHQKQKTYRGSALHSPSARKTSVCSYSKLPHREKNTGTAGKQNKHTTCARDVKTCKYRSSVVLSSDYGDGAKNMVPEGIHEKQKTYREFALHSSPARKLSVCSYPKPPYREKNTVTAAKQNKHTTCARDVKTCKSSLGKSIVGSSSTVGYSVRSKIPASSQGKEGSSGDSVPIKNMQTTSGGTALKPSKAFSVRSRNTTSNPRPISKTVMRTISCQKAAMSKVLQDAGQIRKSDSSGGDFKKPSSAVTAVMKNDGDKRFSKPVLPGKENITGNVVMSKNFTCADKIAAATPGVQLTQERNTAHNGSKGLLIGPKLKEHGKSIAKDDGKQETTARRWFYFR